MDVQLPNPFDKERPYVRPEGMSTKEWTRMGVMALVFVLVLGLMIVLHFVRKPSKSSPQVRKPAATGGNTQEPPNKEGPPPAQNLEEKAAETLRSLRDGPDPVRKDQPEFLDFLYLLLSLPREEAARRVVPAIGPKELLLDPQSHRGKFVRLRGRLIQLYTEPLPVTTTTGTRDVYMGVLQTYPTNLTVTFYLPERPLDDKGEPLKFRTKNYHGETLIEDWVEIEGMFLRIYEYEGQAERGGRSPTIRAPLIFARTIRPTPLPTMSDPKSEFLWIVVGATAVVIGLVIFAGIVTRRRDRKSLRMEMFDVRKEKAKETGKPIFPKPDPILGEAQEPPAEKPS